MIKVLIVDDSPVAIAVIKRMIAKSPKIEVVGTAGNGREALKLIPLIKPDVICTDLHMPVMDGLEFTREVMARNPLPILLVSVSGREDSLNAFEVINAGALDIFQKPRGDLGPDFERFAPELIMKIKVLSGVHVFRKPKYVSGNTGISVTKELKSGIRKPESPSRIIVMGASTGGPQALYTILALLPSGFPLPIICVQHISDGFLHGLVDWLSSQCRMTVKIANAGEVPQPGTVYFPHEGSHLKIDSTGSFVISHEPPFDGHRPSITVTMISAAQYFGNSAIGVLLTGMGKDGAEGLQQIKKSGGITIAQDEATSIVFGMPQQAIALGAAEHIVPLDEIGPMILDFVVRTLEWKE